MCDSAILRCLTEESSMMEFINLTPHAINVFAKADDATGVAIQPSGTVARVIEEPDLAATSRTLTVGAPGVSPVKVRVLSAPKHEGVEGLPEPKAGTVFIVSGMVLAHCAGRPDVFAPATGPNDGVLRDDNGQIKGVTALRAAPH